VVVEVVVDHLLLVVVVVVEPAFWDRAAMEQAALEAQRIRGEEDLAERPDQFETVEIMVVVVAEWTTVTVATVLKVPLA
jgi:hypothetical protein